MWLSGCIWCQSKYEFMTLINIQLLLIKKSKIGALFNTNRTRNSIKILGLNHMFLDIIIMYLLQITYIKLIVPLLGTSNKHIINIFSHKQFLYKKKKKSKQLKCVLYISTWRPTSIPAICARKLKSRVCWVGISVRFWWSDAIKYQVKAWHCMIFGKVGNHDAWLLSFSEQAPLP